MAISPRIVLSLLKQTFTEWLDDKAARLAAALAYYAVFSLAPMLVIAIAIAGAIFGERAARGEIVGQIQGFVGAESATLIQQALENASRPDLSSVASYISLGVLFFAASGVVIQLQDALNTLWEVEPRPGRAIITFISKRILSFVMVFGIGLFLLLSLLVSAILSALSNTELIASVTNYEVVPGFSFLWLWKLLSFIISLSLITFLFALIFKFVPDAKVAWKDVWVGAWITSILFAIGRSLLGWYLGQGGIGSTYGAAGSLVVLLAWIYYSAQILLFGAEFTQVFAHRYGSQIRPSRNAVSVGRRVILEEEERSPE